MPLLCGGGGSRNGVGATVRQSPWDMFDPMHVGSVQQLVLALPLASRAGPIEASDIDAGVLH